MPTTRIVSVRSRFSALTATLAAAALSTTCATTKRAALITDEQAPRSAKFELTYWTKPREITVGCSVDQVPLPTVPSAETIMEVVHEESGHVWRCPRAVPSDWPNISFLPQCESSSDWHQGNGNYVVRVLPNGRSDEPTVECSFRYDDASIRRISVEMFAPTHAGAEATWLATSQRRGAYMRCYGACLPFNGEKQLRGRFQCSARRAHGSFQRCALRARARWARRRRTATCCPC
jgi:hypothetical protein